jgi:hypothetical protein
LRLLEDSRETRAHYAALHAQAPNATVYQAPAWLDLWKHLGADIAFVEVSDETMVPFVCRGHGALRRAYSLPFDTYGGPVTTRPNAPVMFEAAIALLGSSSVRMVDFGAGVASSNGAASPLTCHLVDLSGGYAAASARYHDANQRLLRQARERGVRVEVMNDAAGVDAFYRLHLRTVARYGARAMPRSFFRALFATLVPAELATFYLARRGDDVVAGNLVLRWAGRASDWMWVYDDRYLSLRATNLLIDRAVHDEAARGSRELNLGASPNDRLGSVRFKQSFGARPFHYRVYTHTMPWLGMARQVRSNVNRVGARIRLLAES